MLCLASLLLSLGRMLFVEHLRESSEALVGEAGGALRRAGEGVGVAFCHGLLVALPISDIHHALQDVVGPLAVNVAALWKLNLHRSFLDSAIAERFAYAGAAPRGNSIAAGRARILAQIAGIAWSAVAADRVRQRPWRVRELGVEVAVVKCDVGQEAANNQSTEAETSEQYPDWQRWSSSNSAAAAATASAGCHTKFLAITLYQGIRSRNA